MESSFLSGQVLKVFNKSLELGVCARCGTLVVFTEGDVMGALVGEDDILFYTCDICVDVKEDIFFRNKWYDYYLTR